MCIENEDIQLFSGTLLEIIKMLSAPSDLKFVNIEDIQPFAVSSASLAILSQLI